MAYNSSFLAVFVLKASFDLAFSTPPEVDVPLNAQVGNSVLLILAVFWTSFSNCSSFPESKDLCNAMNFGNIINFGLFYLEAMKVMVLYLGTRAILVTLKDSKSVLLGLHLKGHHTS